MAHLFGIDVGGTSIKVGLFTTEGELVKESNIPTGAIDNEAEYKNITDSLKLVAAQEHVSVNDILGIGLDVPGPVDSSGNMGMLANIKMDPVGLKVALMAAFPAAKLRRIRATVGKAAARLLHRCAGGSGGAIHSEVWQAPAYGVIF